VTIAAPGSKVLGARVAVVVDNLEKTCRLYQRLVGPDFKFWVSPSLMGDTAYENLTNTHGQFRLAEAMVPGSPVVMELIEYKNHSKHFQRGHFQDPGAAHFLFMTKDDDVMIDRVKADGLHTTSRQTRRFSSLRRRACSSCRIRKDSGWSSWTTT